MVTDAEIFFMMCALYAVFQILDLLLYLGTNLGKDKEVDDD